MNINPYIIHWRTDKDGRPMSKFISEEPCTVQVSIGDEGKPCCSYVLDEIPDSYERVKIRISSNGRRLAEKLDRNVSGYQFYVDYNHGIVYFSDDLKGQNVSISYYGRGFKQIDRLRVQNVIVEKGSLSNEEIAEIVVDLVEKGSLSNEEIDNIIAQLESMKK